MDLEFRVCLKLNLIIDGLRLLLKPIMLFKFKCEMNVCVYTRPSHKIQTAKRFGPSSHGLDRPNDAKRC